MILGDILRIKKIPGKKTLCWIFLCVPFSCPSVTYSTAQHLMCWQQRRGVPVARARFPFSRALRAQNDPSARARRCCCCWLCLAQLLRVLTVIQLLAVQSWRKSPGQDWPKICWFFVRQNVRCELFGTYPFPVTFLIGKENLVKWTRSELPWSLSEWQFGCFD